MGVDTDDGVAAILVDRDGRFLLQLRDNIEGIFQPGVWSIVGGAIEIGESAYDAAVREIQEEVGQKVERLYLIGKIPALWSGGTLHLFCGGAAFSDGDIVVGEGQDARFFSPGDINLLEPAAPFLKPLVNGFVSDPRYRRCMQEAASSG